MGERFKIGDIVRISRPGANKDGYIGHIVGVAQGPIDEGEYLVQLGTEILSVHYTDLVKLD